MKNDEVTLDDPTLLPQIYISRCSPTTSDIRVGPGDPKDAKDLQFNGSNVYGHIEHEMVTPSISPRKTKLRNQPEVIYARVRAWGDCEVILCGDHGYSDGQG